MFYTKMKCLSSYVLAQALKNHELNITFESFTFTFETNNNKKICKFSRHSQQFSVFGLY